MARLLVVSRSMALALRLADSHEVVEHSAEALDTLNPDPQIDVVVLDVGEPATAVAVLDTLRRSGSIVPVLIVSGYQPAWAGLAALDLPGVVVVPLPITRTALLTGIERLESGRRARTAVPQTRPTPTAAPPAEQPAAEPAPHPVSMPIWEDPVPPWGTAPSDAAPEPTPDEPGPRPEPVAGEAVGTQAVGAEPAGTESDLAGPDLTEPDLTEADLAGSAADGADAADSVDGDGSAGGEPPADPHPADEPAAAGAGPAPWPPRQQSAPVRDLPVQASPADQAGALSTAAPWAVQVAAAPGQHLVETESGAFSWWPLEQSEPADLFVPARPIRPHEALTEALDLAAIRATVARERSRTAGSPSASDGHGPDGPVVLDGPASAAVEAPGGDPVTHDGATHDDTAHDDTAHDDAAHDDTAHDDATEDDSPAEAARADATGTDATGTDTAEVDTATAAGEPAAEGTTATQEEAAERHSWQVPSWGKSAWQADSWQEPAAKAAPSDAPRDVMAAPAAAEPAGPEPTVREPAAPDTTDREPALPEPAALEPAVPEPAVPEPAALEPAAPGTTDQEPVGPDPTATPRSAHGPEVVDLPAAFLPPGEQAVDWAPAQAPTEAPPVDLPLPSLMDQVFDLPARQTPPDDVRNEPVAELPSFDAVLFNRPDPVPPAGSGHEEGAAALPGRRNVARHASAVPGSGELEVPGPAAEDGSAGHDGLPGQVVDLRDAGPPLGMPLAAAAPADPAEQVGSPAPFPDDDRWSRQETEAMIAHRRALLGRPPAESQPSALQRRLGDLAGPEPERNAAPNGTFPGWTPGNGVPVPPPAFDGPAPGDWGAAGPAAPTPWQTDPSGGPVVPPRWAPPAPDLPPAPPPSSAPAGLYLPPPPAEAAAPLGHDPGDAPWAPEPAGEPAGPEPEAEPDPVVERRSAPSVRELVRSLVDRSGELFGVADTCEVLAEEIVERAAAEAAAIIVPDGPVWRVSGGVGLRPLERRLVLDATHWVVTEIALGGRALLVGDNDAVRQYLTGAPLAAWDHLLVVPLPDVNAAVVVARSRSGRPFTADDLDLVIGPAREAAGLLSTAMATRRLARLLTPLTEDDGG